MRRAVCLLFVYLAFSLSAFAQSADQEIVSVVDAPDPVVPGNNVTYTVTVRNNGPDAATNGGLNIVLSGAVTPVSVTPPAGFTCTGLSQFMTCSAPSFAAGTTPVFTVVVGVPASLLNFADGSFTSNFSTSGVTPDPNNGNNQKNASTTYDSPQINMGIAVTDLPDPVTPNNDITYTVNISNAGPDAGTNAQFSTFNNGSLRYQSITIPAGWTCPTLPSVGSAPNVSCTKATYAAAETATFTLVARADPVILGINDGTVSTFFGINATGNETNNADNGETENTAYQTPDADMAVTVADLPDPVTPNNDITYTVIVTNNGPDTATNALLSSFNNGSLRYQSATVPAGWSCTLPSVGSAPNISCTNASFANAATSTFTVVARADPAILGINDGTVATNFSVSSAAADPNNSNSSETENTAYQTPDADMAVTVTDSPDPVFPDNDVTFTATVTNNGPDAATNANFSVFNNGSLRYQSMTIPASWSCPTLPSVGGSPAFTCTNASFANGASSVFTVVLRADSSVLGINDTTLQTAFTVGSSVSDPNNANSSETESTQYTTPDANVGVTAADAPDPVTPGNNITYTGSVTNAGPDAATSTTFTIALHPSLRFQSLTGPAGFTCNSLTVGTNGTITCTNASFANGSNVPFTLVAQVDPSLLSGPDGSITQTFVISSSNVQDPTQANNSASVTTAYQTPDADLSVTNSDAPDPVNPGGTITYTQSITNSGPDAATSVVFAQTIPASVGFASLTPPAGWSCATPGAGASGLVQCTIASLASGVTAPFTLTLNVLASSGTVGNTVTASSSTYDPDPPDNSASVTTTIVAAASADLSVSIGTATTSAPIGSTFPYTIVVTNGGPDAAANVVMTDVLPPGLLFRSITQPAGFTCTTPAVGANGTITCNAATLASGGSATFTLVVEVAQGATGSLVNGASVGSSTADPTSGNSSSNAAAIPTGAAVADVVISKTTTASSVATGSTFSYTLTVTNNGPSPATNVIVTDTLPASLQFVSATPSQGTCNAASPLSCNVGTLAVSASATITLNVRVVGTSGSITNSANVSATEDPSGGAATAPAVSITATPVGAPTLSEWALMLLGAMLAMVALARMR